MMDAAMHREQQRTVSVFSDDAAFCQEVRTAIGVLPHFKLQTHPLDAARAAQQHVPAVMVLDLGSGDLLDEDVADRIVQAAQGAPLLVVSDQLSQDRMRALMRLKAADWLPRPLDVGDLVNAVRNLAETGARVAGRVSTVTGVAGGPGTTSVVLTMARAAARSADRRVAIVDLDFQSASVNAYLDLTNEFDLSSIVSSPSRLDAELCDQMQLNAEPGISVYSFDCRSLPFEPKGRDLVLRLLDLIAFRHDEVVIDLPPGHTPWFADVVAASDQLFLVLEANVPSLRHARAALERLSPLRKGRSHVVPVVNKFVRRLFGNMISKQDIEKIFNGGAIHSLARDDALLAEALNRGVFCQDVNKGARFVKEVEALWAEVAVTDAAR